ncbi:hypothetical protein D9Q81_02545 [Candidatus Korarchaeum cryptofilum]|uniref:Molybdopterin-guanine dinucleotide biosynthesis protein B (MobB) domain-containing protein n=1 Tax=Candidatus Korarchaeum cryptofilum TaxID=498846 RepID=A0A429G6W0_9CREN|nr:hypothetical protein [Candidatus Korarchaeum cryptofilum]RSN69502.1 hypothetical protein D9Q81_02545 [Candidatus Korarchaeum cryptofilum]
MLIVGVMGSRKDVLMKPLIRAFTNRSYRVAAATQNRRIGVPDELKELAEAGSSLRIACSIDRVLISSNFPLRGLDDIIKAVSSLSPIEPDVIVLFGFEDILGREERVLKVITASSSHEAEQLLERLSKPVVGVYVERGDFEGGYKDLDVLIGAIIEEGIKRKLLQPSPLGAELEG